MAKTEQDLQGLNKITGFHRGIEIEIRANACRPLMTKTSKSYLLRNKYFIIKYRADNLQGMNDLI